MQYRPLGRSGIQISALSLGSYITFGGVIDRPGAVELMRTAYDAGVNFFDNAEGYAGGESERIMGDALAELAWPRDSYLLSSKVFFGADPNAAPLQRGLNRKHVLEACDQALERLQVDYLDLYFCHRPDPKTPIVETVRAMHELIMRGKVLYWGTSEWSARQLREAFADAERYHLTPPTMEQPQYNILHRTRVELEYAHLYSSHGLGTTTWGPLSSGVLSGKYNDEIPDGTRLDIAAYAAEKRRLTSPAGERILAVVREFTRLAASIDATTAQLAIAWCLRNPNVSSVLLGASNVDQLRENLGAVDVLSRIDAGLAREMATCLRALPRNPLLRIPGGSALARAAYGLNLR